MSKEQTSINTLHYNDEIYTDSEAKANILNNQFHVLAIGMMVLAWILRLLVFGMVSSNLLF